jgi:hypothetical protein
VLFSASGEALALTGYPFPPASPGDPAFVDGWAMKFTRLLVTVDKITLSENPDFSPGDQSQTGALVAEADGPWAIDLARSDPSYLPGKGGGGEQAVPIVALSNQNKHGGDGFANDGTRYAFGFDSIAATPKAMNVNLDAAAVADYEQMIAGGCNVLYVGTATFAGDDTCNAGHEGWPSSVNFWLCFKSPTSYVNCQNPDDDPARAFDGEEHQRGIAFRPNVSTIAQITFHTDHPFWDSTLHDSPAHFDQFAAQFVKAVSPAPDGGVDAGGDGGTLPAAGGAPTVTLESVRGVDYTQVTDALGRNLSWRYCIDPPTDVHAQLVGPMSFRPEGVPHCVGENHATGLCDYYDFTTYNQSTQGHANGDGLCFVKRNDASPP